MSHATPTSVTQGSDFGNAYPFIKPSDDVRGLLTDLYFAFDAGCAPALPISVYWLYGLGSASASLPGDVPTPVHAAEVLLKDAEGNTVFDSTEGSYVAVTWGDRTIIEWVTRDAVCRLVRQSVTETDWLSNIVPEDGRLDARAYHGVPTRMNSLKVGATTVSSGAVELTEGHNVSLSAAKRPTVDGGRVITSVTLQAIPGRGAGTVPGCADPEVLIRRINGVGPDASGNFVLDTTDCYRLQVPVVPEGDGPIRTATYGGFGLSDEQAAHGVVLFNDCVPCCRCEDYANTYKGLSATWSAWQAVATSLEAVRNDYADNRSRWHAAKACAANNPAKLWFMPEGGATLRPAATFCNVLDCSLDAVELRFTARLFNNGAELPGTAYTFAAADGQAEGGDSRDRLPITPRSLKDKVFSYFFREVSPGKFALVIFRLYLTSYDLGMAAKIDLTAQISLTVHAAGPCSMPDKSADVPAGVTAIWLDGSPITGDTVCAVLSDAQIVDESRRTYGC